MPFDRRTLLAGGLGTAGTLAAAAAAAAAGPRRDASETARRVTPVDASAGLVPDGANDQTAALQAAIDRAAAARAELRLPAGRFRVGAIELRPGTRLAGVGPATVLEYVGGGALLLASEANDLALSDLTLDGAGLALDAARADALVALDACAGLRLARIAVTRSLLGGIALRKCAGTISDCEVRRVSQAGIVSIDAAGLDISHNTIADCANNGIQVWRSKPGEDGTIVAANRIERIAAKAGGSGENGNGINVFRAGNVLVTGNRIADCAYSAIRGNAASNIQMVANATRRSGEVALYAEFGFEGAVIASNVVDGAATGIGVTNFNEGGRLAVVQGNLIRNLVRREHEPVDKRGDGIGIEADAVVSGNVIEGAASAGIVVGWGPYMRDVVVTQNLIREARVGILVSADRDAGACLIAQNMVSGTRDGAIRAMTSTGSPVGPDLATAAPTSPRLAISGNVAV